MHGVVAILMQAGTASPQLFLSQSHLGSCSLLSTFPCGLWLCLLGLGMRQESLEEKEAKVWKQLLKAHVT